MQKYTFVLFLLYMVSNCAGNNITASLNVTSTTLEIEDQIPISISFSQPLAEKAIVYFIYQSGNTYSTDPLGNITLPIDNITVEKDDSEASFTVEASAAGSIIISLASNSSQFYRLNSTYIRVTVVHSKVLAVINAVIGWIYFVAWSVSFYPQVYINWKRKSVVGLNFDFLGYNITGFIAYGVFNIGMFWIGEIKRQYKAEHPYGINPVQINDVFFTLHAIFITVVTISQCFIYERGGQRLSKISIVLLCGAWLFALVTCFLGVGKVISWLTYVYFFSYIKLAVTLIKYIPQAYMNYCRKSTVGWSIGNVLLDCTGGTLSLLQMFLLSYNNDDWGSIFGDPTKFGLGAFSILFDILFIVQHYVLYRNNFGYTTIQDEFSDEHKD